MIKVKIFKTGYYSRLEKDLERNDLQNKLRDRSDECIAVYRRINPHDGYEFNIYFKDDFTEEMREGYRLQGIHVSAVGDLREIMRDQNILSDQRKSRRNIYKKNGKIVVIIN